MSRILNTHEAQFLYNARQYDDAVASLKRVLAQAPHFWVAHIVLGKILGLRGQFRRTLGEFSKARRYSGGNTEAVGLRGHTLAVSGSRSEARRVLRELEARSRRHYVPPLLTFLAIEPRWDPVRKTMQFDSIRKRVGLPIVSTAVPR